MSFQLLDDRIAVMADEVEETAPSGLILTDSAMSPLRYGTVIHVGTGRTENGVNVPITVAVGDRVFWHRSSGGPLTIEGDEFIILGNREIIGVVR